MKRMRDLLLKSVALLLTLIIVAPAFGNTVFADEGETTDPEYEYSEDATSEEDEVVVSPEDIADPEIDEDVDSSDDDSDVIVDASEEDMVATDDAAEYLYIYGGFASVISDETSGGNVSGAATAIANGIRSGNYTISVSAYNLSRDELRSAFSTALNDNPEFYFISNSYSYSYSGTLIKSITVSKGMAQADIDAIESKCNYVTNLAVNAATEYDKALIVHDYLVANTAYATTELNSGSAPQWVYNPYGVLVKERAVCQGYAETYALIMRKLGIDCRLADSDAMNHAWNIIKIGGSWYHVDCTWDDPTEDVQGRVWHEHFLKSDSKMRNTLDHYSWTAATTCTSTKYDNDWTYTVNYEIVIIGTTYYYVTYSSSGNKLMKRSGTSSTTILTYASTNRTSLSYVYGNLYFNDSTKVYRYTPNTTTYTSVANLNSGSFYGLHILANGIGRYQTAPSVGGAYKTYQFVAPPTPTPTSTPSPAHRAFAERLYTCALNRASDASGLNYWADKLANGFSGAEAARGFFFSAELNGLSNQEFVARLYRTFMNREGDATGMNYWLSKMNAGTTKEAVFNSFVNSQEWADYCYFWGIVSGSSVAPNTNRPATAATIEFATRLYTTCLGRNGESSGIQYWAKELANGRQSGQSAAYQFFFSSEFTAGNYSNAEFVKRLYRTFMGREGVTSEVNYWVSVMNNGQSREAIFYSFSTSVEFTNLCNQAGIRPV